MFDVDWSDPNRESVGDRRARKKKEREDKIRKQGRGGAGEYEGNGSQDKKDGQQSSQASGYGSVRSSLSSVEKQFGFFGGKNRRKGHDSIKTKSTKAKSTKTQSTASSSLRSPTIHIATQEQEQEQEQENPSNNGEVASLSPPESPRIPGPIQLQGTPGLPHKRFSSFSDALLRRWEEDASGGSLLGYDMANPRPGTRTSLTQDMGDGTSWVTKSIEVTSRPRTDEDGDYLVFEITISACGPEDEPKDPASTKPSPWQPLPQLTENFRHLPTVPESPPSPSLDEAHHLEPIISVSTPCFSNDLSRAISSHKTKPRLDAPPIAPTSQRYIGNPYLWRAPDDWGCRPTETAVSLNEEPEVAVPTGTEEENRLALDLTSMQRDATRMLQASPQTILLRLKGTWGSYAPSSSCTNDFNDLPDSATAAAALESALTYKELEMEKKRWMICALRHMEALTDPDGVLSQPKEKPKAQRILALFDNQATASYLAYLHPGTPVYHLSPDPLSRKQYPNVHPMHCPFISASSVSFAKEAYSTVNCLPIASIVPSSEIPSLLRRVHHVLARGGSLDMVVIDPCPAGADARSSSSSTTGPALRRWLDENLVFNLEQQFRCTNPSRNFPVWLQEARLRARGSVITTTRFQAIPRPWRRRHRAGTGGGSRRGSDREEGHEGLEGLEGHVRREGEGEEVDDDDEEEELEAATRRELRAVVGRMLWQDIWGPFVTADRWWWDVPEIVDECVELETHWEYSIIVACKESDD